MQNGFKQMEIQINYVESESKAQHLISAVVMDLRGRTDFVFPGLVGLL